MKVAGLWEPDWELLQAGGRGGPRVPRLGTGRG